MARYHAADWIKHLHLTRHIEGGWYNEVYRSDTILPKDHLPTGFPDQRSICTHIYFLLEKHGFSAFHRIRSDELWHFYAGDPLVIFEIDQSGQLIEHLLGHDTQNGQHLFCVIQKGNWFASKVLTGGEYALAGCTVAPGFDFNDFELAKREILIKEYPQHADLVTMLTDK